MTYRCAHCQAELALDSSESTSRRDVCPKCSGDLHCCLNCRFYDPGTYNDCREPQADRVLDKASCNFCEYFAFAETDSAKSSSAPSKIDYLKSLDSLFK